MQKKKVNQKEKRCFGSVRYADGESAAEQAQGLPAVIAELTITRWAAQNQNLEQPLKSEINVGSRLSEKGRRLKRRITKCNTTRGKPSFEGRSESIRMETGRRGERKIWSLQAASNNGFSAASHCRMNNGSAGLDEQPSLEKNSEKPCHLERNWLLTDF